MPEISEEALRRDCAKMDEMIADGYTAGGIIWAIDEHKFETLRAIYTDGTIIELLEMEETENG